MSDQTTEKKPSIFMNLENTKPFAKIAFEGFAGDGKSYTAAHLAIGIHKMIKSTKPIAWVDTERAADKLKPQFDKNGIHVQVASGRTLATVSEAIKMCVDGFADILVIDSITHVWESFTEAFKANKKKNNSFLEFQDWGQIKPQWKREFSDKFVMANCHIIFTGRAGYEYQDEKNEETGKREIFKSGIKMKAETETAFEPDILVLMEKVQKLIGDEKEIYRVATIVKDRTSIIDGKTFKNPTFNDFYPAIKQLLDGAVKNIHGAELPDTFKDFESRFSENGKRKGLAISEIEGCFNLMQLGTGKEDKALKAAILNKVFDVLSVDKMETKQFHELEDGLLIIKDFTIKYNEYMESCIALQTKPEVKEIARKLDEAIAAFNLFAGE